MNNLSLKSLFAVAVLAGCIPGPSLAATKWARCTPYPKDRKITVVYEVELKPDSDKISLTKDVKVDQGKLPSGTYAESSRSQIITRAKWFPSEVVIGPFKAYNFLYTYKGENRLSDITLSLGISREDLSYRRKLKSTGIWSDQGTCKIIPNPVKTLF